MKGRNHSVLTLMTFIVALIILIVFLDFRLYGIPENLSAVFWILAFIFVFLGSISPDSDSANRKSTIYFISKPFAYFMKISEMSIAIITGHKIEHRGVLHKPIGIIITSILLGLFVYLVLFLLGLQNIYFALYLSLIFMISQFTHIFQDFLYDRFGRVSSILFFLIVLVVALGLVFMRVYFK